MKLPWKPEIRTLAERNIREEGRENKRGERERERRAKLLGLSPGGIFSRR